MISAILQSIRSLRQRPAFAGFTLALIIVGVGAAAAIFGVVHGSLLRPLPYADPSKLFNVGTILQSNTGSATPAPVTAHELVRWRSDASTLSGLEGYAPSTMKITGGASPDALPGMSVSAGIFDLLGVKPQRGRVFRRDEEAGGSGVAIISARLWETRFGRDPDIVGRTVTIEDEPRQIIGVMPTSFTMLFQPCDIWLPLILTSDRLTGPVRLIGAVGRLKNGSSMTQALSELTSLEADIASEEPMVYRATAPSLTPLREFLFGSQRTTLIILMSAVVLLVVIGAVNVAGLVGADAVARRTATMTRLALGSSRRALIANRLREGVILATAGLIPALLGAAMLLAAAQALSPGLAVGPEAIAHPLVLGFAIGIALLMGVITMIPSAIAEAAVDISTLAGAATKTAGGRGERLSRDVVLGAQVAVTVVLLVAATLLGRNLSALLNKWPGFEQSGVLVAPLAVSVKTYPGVQDRAHHVEQILAEVGHVSGVVSAGTIQTRFMLNENMSTAIEVDGKAVASDVQQTTNIRHVSPSIFGVLKTRVLAGRVFDDTDRDGSRLVAVVNNSFARKYLSPGNPIGMQIRRANRKDAPWIEVIGVVEDIADAGAGVDLGPAFYVSYFQQNTVTARVTLVVRTLGDPARITEAVRRAVWKVDPDQAIESTVPLTTLMTQSAAQSRLRAVLVALFSASGLLIVLTGIFATTQYSVIRRTREIGVRAALGAPPARLLATVLGEAVKPAVIGLVAGAIAAIPTASIMQSSLKESLAMRDAQSIGIVLAGFVALAVVAAFVPARKAVSISPTVAMRA